MFCYGTCLPLRWQGRRRRRRKRSRRRRRVVVVGGRGGDGGRLQNLRGSLNRCVRINTKSCVYLRRERERVANPTPPPPAAARLAFPLAVSIGSRESDKTTMQTRNSRHELHRKQTELPAVGKVSTTLPSIHPSLFPSFRLPLFFPLPFNTPSRPSPPLPTQKVRYASTGMIMVTNVAA